MRSALQSTCKPPGRPGGDGEPEAGGLGRHDKDRGLRAQRRFRRRPSTSSSADHLRVLGVSTPSLGTSPLPSSCSVASPSCGCRSAVRRSSSPVSFPATIWSLPPPPASPRLTEPDAPPHCPPSAPERRIRPRRRRR